MRIFTFVTFLFSVVKYVTCTETTDASHFVRTYQLPSIYSANVKSVVELRSKLECAQNCEKDIQCTTFSFDKEHRHCTKAAGNQEPNSLGYGPTFATYSWRLEVHTSDVFNGGTSAYIYVTILGQLDHNSATVFFQPRFLFDTPKNDFVGGSASVMSITTGFPIPTQILIQNVRWYFGDDWHLQKAVMINDQTGERIIFPWNNWIESGEPAYTINAQ